MEFTFTLGDKEKTEVQLRRNQFTGMFTYRVNGELKTLRSPADASTETLRPSMDDTYVKSLCLSDNLEVTKPS
jgi:hypothetical protein